MISDQNSQHFGKSKKSKRSFFFLILFLMIIVVFSLSGTYWYFVLSREVTTDNAYVHAEVAQITSSISGNIKIIHVINTQHVKKGDVLVVIDDIDTKLALEMANAQVKAAKAHLQKTEIESARRQALAKSGSVSTEEVTTAKSLLLIAQADFEKAQVSRKRAQIEFERTVIRAPINGVVAKKQIQLGQYIQPGMPLMSLVPLEDVYVEANFKESQLKHVHVGQKVELFSDLYGKDLVFHGVVEGFSGGTGSAFAIIPAQNATGNWIKVVQRLPLRIKLDPLELKKHPLQVGLSMEAMVKID
jgi:membrane fusion protein, multidrug efflux system